MKMYIFIQALMYIFKLAFIDESNMKVFEVLESLKKGEKLKEIANVLGINNSTLQRKLKALGYAVDSSTKEWFYNDKDN
ncbi:helix-turn-helix domain-containing protein, partial [Bacillus cereus]|nr:helix-turn-helix domain-containing protein [Bacillus cereus]